MATKRPWEAYHVRTVSLSVAAAARTGDTVVSSGWESPPRERDFLSQFRRGGGDGEQGTRCRIRRPSTPLPLSLHLGSQEEEQQQNRQQVVDDGAIPHAPRQPGLPLAPPAGIAVSASPPLPPFPAPRHPSASVTGEPAGGHSTPRHLRRAASCAPAPAPKPCTPRCASPAPPRRLERPATPIPRARAPHLPQAINTCDGVGAEPAESWWCAQARKNDGLGRDAWLSHHGLLATQAAQRCSDAVDILRAARVGPALLGAELLRACVDAGFTCPACRLRPANMVIMPRTHLCLCWDCTYVFRDDPALACPVCAAVRAWGIISA